MGVVTYFLLCGYTPFGKLALYPSAHHSIAERTHRPEQIETTKSRRFKRSAREITLSNPRSIGKELVKLVSFRFSSFPVVLTER